MFSVLAEAGLVVLVVFSSVLGPAWLVWFVFSQLEDGWARLACVHQYWRTGGA